MSERTALVLIPGLVCDAAVWAYPRAALADVAECVVPDVAASQTMRGMAEEVLAAAPPRFALAGFSMGGYIALEVLRIAPERVTRLAMIDSGCRDDTPQQTAVRTASIEDCENGRYGAVIEAMLPLLLHPTRLTEPLADLVRAMSARVGADCFVRRQKALMSRGDRRDTLSQAKIPVRVICGRDDRLTPMSRSLDIVESAPGARLSIIEDCGHMPTLERPQAAAALLRDWLIYD